MAKIIKDGFFFRAVNDATGFRSSLVTSAAQAGMIIERKFGKDAHLAAYEDFFRHVFANADAVS